MNLTPTPPIHPSPAVALADLLESMCDKVAAHGAQGLVTVALHLLVWGRLRRMAQRARRLAARIAGGAPPLPPRGPRPPGSTPSRPYARMPGGYLWLVRAVPGTAWCAERLRFMLDQPAMAEAARTRPMRRMLRPLCRMLGVALPPLPNPPPEPDTPEAAAPEPVTPTTKPFHPQPHLRPVAPPRPGLAASPVSPTIPKRAA